MTNHTAPAMRTRNGDSGQPVEAEPVQIDMADPHSPFRADIDAAYAELRARGPVVRVAFGSTTDGEERPACPGREMLMVTHYAQGVAALLDDRLSSDPRVTQTDERRAPSPAGPQEPPPLSQSLLSSDPPDHTRLRKLVQPGFTGRAIEALRPRAQAIADELLDRAEREATARGERAPGRRMDLIEAFAYPLSVTVICEMLGIPAPDRQTVLPWTERLLIASGPQMPEDTRTSLQQFIAYLRELFVRKRQHPAEDLISRLVHAAQDGDMLSEQELLSMVFLLFIAGHATTMHLIANGVLALLAHPDQLAKVQADPSMVRAAVEETLRYWGPVDNITRIAKQDVELAGTAIGQGELVTVSLASADRDPTRFADPDVFDVTRADAGRHIAFGKGVHLCLGAPLARVEGQVALTTLLQRCPQLRLAVPAGDLVWRPDFLRGLQRLPVRF
ncbi:MAG: cytochrome P450 family protein [Egibacteraceae bacterium]